jgi:hypothetical protein
MSWGLVLSGLTIMVSLMSEKEAEKTEARQSLQIMAFGCNRMFLSGTGTLIVAYLLHCSLRLSETGPFD